MPAPDDPRIGTILAGRYQILDRLGSGGMGSIYRGVHTSLGRPVAIKLLAAKFAREPQLVQRFLREAQAAASVRHDNIVDIEDVDQLPEGGAFFVMELLEGRDLAQLLRKEGRLPWPRARAIIVQTTRALAAAHAAGIVHRDMKPANVFLISRRGTNEFVKIIDFGVAKVESQSKLTREGMVLGTAGYMAPEQIMSRTVDARTDVYAVCCLLFELLTGRRPFLGDDYMKVLVAHMHEPPPRLRERAPELGFSAELEQLILRGLAKAPEQRFADMLELERSLQAIDQGPSAKPNANRPSPPPSPVEPGDCAVEATQILELPRDPGLLDQPELPADLLGDLAYLFVAFAHGSDGVLTNDEMRSLADRLRGWAPKLGLPELGQLLSRVVGEYGRFPAALKTAETRHSTEFLGFRLSDAQRAKLLADLQTIAAADGQVGPGELRFMQALAQSFVNRRDPRLRAYAVLYLVVGQSADGIDSRELQVITNQLRCWVPEAPVAELDEVLRETKATFAQLPQAADRLDYARRCADRLAASTDKALLREVLADLWRIAGVDGEIAPAEQRFIMDVVERFGTLA